MAELIGGRVAGAATWAGSIQIRPALAAEFRLYRVFVAASRAAHPSSPQDVMAANRKTSGKQAPNATV
jgi:hypothetical protein